MTDTISQTWKESLPVNKKTSGLYLITSQGIHDNIQINSDLKELNTCQRIYGKEQ